MAASTANDERSGGYRSFARAAALAFAAVAAYTLGVKLPVGELSRDWAHTALHVATGFMAAYAGRGAADARAARGFTLALVTVYGAPGVAGWFVDGLLTSTVLRIPLGAADHVFHLLLAVGGAATIASGERLSYRRSSSSSDKMRTR